MSKMKNAGFTMVEMLAVVAILVILLGVSVVSVVRYRDMLKLTELDNAAREIYMAAENRAVLLSGARRLNNQLDKQAGTPTALTGYDWHSEEEELCYVSRASVTQELLAAGSIDPALWEGDFYIVYDKISGSVTDVFYAESSMDSLVGADFAVFYGNWAMSRSDRLAKKNEMMVGWYNGLASEGSDYEPGPGIVVEIENGERLTVTVTYFDVPAAPGGQSPATLSVRLVDVDLRNSFSLFDEAVPAGNGSKTWVLDSLDEKKFAELNSGVIPVAPGDDFTVVATLTPQNEAPFSEAVSDKDTSNSLFGEGSGGDIAYIQCLRHLQNLYAGFSGVKGKTAAVQTADLRCRGNETYGNYDFIPISNDALTEYDGGEKEIRGLYVSGTKLTNKDAGLFAETKMNMTGIRLVNATVNAPANHNAG
ncbi:MAG: type II secretion system protein, partial [Dialister sp.]|nr:type II secretion system protein [Dialister sp.]